MWERGLPGAAAAEASSGWLWKGKNFCSKGPTGMGKRLCQPALLYGVVDVAAEGPAKKMSPRPDIWKLQFPLSSLPVAALELIASWLEETWCSPWKAEMSRVGQEQRPELSPDTTHSTKQCQNCTVRLLEHLDCRRLPSTEQGPKHLCVFE